MARIDSPEEIAELREFFLAHGPDKCRRLAILFAEMFGKTDPIQERDWRDFADDGSLKASPGAMSATNGR